MEPGFAPLVEPTESENPGSANVARLPDSTLTVAWEGGRADHLAWRQLLAAISKAQ